MPAAITNDVTFIGGSLARLNADDLEKVLASSTEHEIRRHIAYFAECR